MADKQKNSGDKPKRKPFHEEFAEKIIARLKEGTAPWQLPWHPGNENMAPHNPASGTVYKGVNRISLAMSDFSDPRWMTLKQANDKGMKILPGSKSTPVVYYQWTDEKDRLDENGKPVLGEDGKPLKQTVSLERPIMRCARVFNAEQIDGMPPLKLTDKSFDWNPMDKAESILAASGAVIKHDQNNRAFYRLRDDSIHLPPRGNFEDAGKYYGTALHELGHWTGHESRLNREHGPFGSEVYAREELRAEIASWMLGQDTGIPHDPEQHAAYVQSWITALEQDPFEIQRACRDAEHIKEYVLDMERKKELGQERHTEKPFHPQKEDRIAAVGLPSVQARKKTWLNVPYKEKDEAKALGAKWDKQEKRWFAPEGTDLSQLQSWLPVENVRLFVWSPTDSPDNKERFSVQVQQAGLWSHIRDRDGEPLRFEKEEDALVLQRQFQQKAPEFLKPLSPEQEFALVLEKAGLDLQGQAPALDGEIHRVPLLDGKKNELNGAYCGYADDPAGWAQNFVTCEKTHWIATGHVLSEEQRREMLREREQQRIDLEERMSLTREDVARDAFNVLTKLEPASRDHPWLKEREVEPFGLFQHTDDKENTLYVPVRNIEGHVRGLQIINEWGDSRFTVGMEKEGNFHLITGPEQNRDGLTSALAPAKDLSQREILLCEGYAIGASLHMATGKPVAVAFDAGNLEPVAKALREQFPQAVITVCADNDHARIQDNEPHNLGVIEAERAAEAVGGRVVIPAFTDTEQARGLTTFNDVHVSRGLEEVERQMNVLGLEHSGQTAKEQDRNLERGLEL
jgi:antirestriction protein ArdC/phage/plasmid primase-like uncharacterized protein